jgi:hypothetical protein
MAKTPASRIRSAISGSDDKVGYGPNKTFFSDCVTRLAYNNSKAPWQQSKSRVKKQQPKNPRQARLPCVQRNLAFPESDRLLTVRQYWSNQLRPSQLLQMAQAPASQMAPARQARMKRSRRSPMGTGSPAVIRPGMSWKIGSAPKRNSRGSQAKCGHAAIAAVKKSL